MKYAFLLGCSFIFSGCLSIESRRCQILTEYLNHEVSGPLVEKYIDHKDHGNKVLVLKLGIHRIVETNIAYMVPGLYDTLQAGDEIIKLKDSDITVVKRDSLRIELAVDRSLWCPAK